MSDGDRKQGWMVCQTITTSDGNDHELMSYSLSNNHSVLVFVALIGQRYNGSADADIFSYTNEFLFNRVGAAATLQAAGEPRQLDPSVTGWVVTVSASGTTALVEVMGTAGENVRWMGRIEVLDIEQEVVA
jgi:hypothetical protein